MSSPLTINRLMGLCAFEAEVEAPENKAPSLEETKEVAKQFWEQMHLMATNELEPAFGEIRRKAEAIDLSVEPMREGFRDLPFNIGRDPRNSKSYVELFPDEPPMSADVEARDPIVGLFGARRYEMTLSGVRWDLRVRPSVTACVLEQRDRLSKLWWTFEGVPLEQDEDTTETRSQDFVRTTTALAEAALPALRDAYARALAKITGEARGSSRHTEHQLRVSLADSTDPKFSELVDAMNLVGVNFQDVAKSDEDTELRGGVDEVNRFVSAVSGQTVLPSKIRYTPGERGNAAVHSLAVKLPSETGASIKYSVSGLASSISMIVNSVYADPEWMAAPTTPSLLRSVSAARPLSARLADSGARRLDSLLRGGGRAYSLS